MVYLRDINLQMSENQPLVYLAYEKSSESHRTIGGPRYYIIIMGQGPLFVNGVMFLSLFPSLTHLENEGCCHYFDSRVSFGLPLLSSLLFHICAIAACAVGRMSDGISAVYLLTTEMARVVDGAAAQAFADFFSV